MLPGGLCVRKQVFVAINKLNFTTHSEGFVGLAPEIEGDDQSYIMSLYKQGQILERKVGLNFEDANNVNKVSQITFGYFDETEISEEGLTKFINYGKETWTTKVRQLKIGDSRVQNSDDTRIAHIDTANMYIQVPQSEFE